MALIFGRHYSKKDLLRHVGDISQIAGIRTVRLQDGPEDAVRALEFKTGSGFQFDVLADRGFDISNASHNGRALNWRSATSDQHPAHFEPEGLGWLRTFYGGLVLTCGLSQAGAPCEDQGQQLGLHGRISHTPAREVSVRQYWEGDEFILEARAKMRETVVFGENLCLERTITSRLGANSLRIRDTVTNEGYETRPHMMLYHINIGFPVVDAGARILAPSVSAVPRDERAQVEPEKWMEMLPPTPGFEERVYFHTMKADSDGYVTVALVNENLPGGPFGVRVRYRQDTLPRFAEWKMNGAGVYTCGLEPANCSVLGRAREREAGTLVHLEPWESREYDVEIGVIDSGEELERVRAAIEACL